MQVFNYHYGYESTGFGLAVLLDQIPNITTSSLHHAYNGSTNALSNSKIGGPIL